MATWNLEHIMRPSDEERMTRQLKEKVAEFAAIRMGLDSMSPEEFVGVLRLEEGLAELSGRLASHAGLLVSEDVADPKRTAHEAMVSELLTEAGNETMFFSLWFRDLDDETAKRLIGVSGPYHYVLERIRAFRRHTLGEKEEKIINIKDLTGVEESVRLYDIITGRYRFEFEGKSLSYDEVSEYKLSPVRAQRRAAYESTLNRYAKDEAVLGEIYRNIVNDVRNEDVKLRGFSSPISAANLGNDVPDGAVDALLAAVRDNGSLFQEYFRLKAKLCDLGEMDRYDLYAPYQLPERKYAYDECVKITLETFRRFSEDAYLMGRRIFDEGHVHSDITANKQPGAFCHTTVKGLTPYLLLNHVGKLNDLFTMMHELGHGIHSMAAHGQTQLTYHPSLPLAETASVFAEMLLSQRLLDEAKEGEKVAVLVRSLDRQYATIMRQAYFTLFERSAHERVAQGATVDDLNSIYLDNLSEQFGGSMAVPEIFQHEWKGIPHLYYSPFYCYTYALANLIVLSLYSQYRREGGDFVPKYMRILSYGGSESPQRILGEAGLDITKKGFWQQGFEEIRGEMGQLRRLIG